MKQASITKKDVKEAVIEALGPFSKAVQKDFGVVHKRLDSVDKRFDSVDKQFEHVNRRLDTIESDVAEMKKNSSELFTKLDAFIKLYEDQKAETKLLSEHVQRLEERLVRLEAKLASKN